MSNTMTRPATTHGGGPDHDDNFDAPALNNVQHLTFRANLPLSGISMGEARRRLRDRLDLPPGSVALVNGTQVNDDHMIKPGEKILFSHVAGAKG